MILVVANNDLELLALRAALESLPAGFPPVRAHGGVGLDAGAPAPTLDGVRAVLVRLHKGRSAWETPFDALRRECVERRIALLAFGGEAQIDAELTALSTAPAGIVTEAAAYWAAGGPANLANLLRFVADTVLLGGFGFEPPADLPAAGLLGRRTHDASRPTVAVVTYRANVLAGNTVPVDQLCDAIEARGANARAVHCYSLRPGPDGAAPAVLDLLRDVDVVVTTTWAAGGAVRSGDARAAGRGEGWASPLDRLGVPVLQAVVATGSTDDWAARAAGLSPLDVTLGVAIPEFDGRIIGPAFAFKEVVDDGDELGVAVSAHRAVPDRVERVAGLAVRLARLRSTPPSRKRVAVVLSAYPTKRSRIGNAVGLDTPASLLAVLDALRSAGYDVAPVDGDADAVMARLADGLTYDVDVLTPAQQAMAAGRVHVDDYSAWFATLPAGLRHAVESTWGPAPGKVCVHDDHLIFAGIELGAALVAVQPPRGFGEDPIAAYHSPNLPAPHHYLAFYRWLDVGWGADAIVHLGKHGTLEWLPGKGAGLSAACTPDAALGDLPLLYPFVVNDPGEGTQAKRRAHALVVDHLPPPMTRAETYDDLARVERLLDEYAKIEALDPAKLPAIRGQLWDLLVTSELVRDLGVEAMPGPDDFAGMVGHIDGYLCALKDAQIRGGLHVLGRAPAGRDLVDTVLAICRQPQGIVPSLRATVAGELGIDPASGVTREIDRLEAECRARVEGLAARDWDPSAGGDDPTLRLGRHHTGAEPAAHVRRGRQPAGGARGRPCARRPQRGSDARRRPRPAHRSELLLRRPRGGALTVGVGRRPRAGRPARRTPRGGDRDVSAHRGAGRVGHGQHAHPGRRRRRSPRPARRASALGRAFRPRPGIWSRSPLAELGRPRVDVTVRISGFFRDAFPERGRPAGRRRDAGRRPRRAGRRQPGPRRGAGRRPCLRTGVRAPTAPASTRPSRAGLGALGPTSPRSTWPGPATPTAAGSPVWSHPTRCAAGSPPSTWR